MYAVLHPPNFAAQAAARARPELRKRPFALLEGEPPSESVCAANKSAKALGIEIGMTRLHAESFPEVLSALRIVEHENTALLTLHAIACSFSPRIESVQAQPGTFALDVSGMNGLFGDDEQLAASLRHRVMAAGFLINVAVAANFHAATCLAIGRNGVSIVPLGYEAQALQTLPLVVLDLAPAHEATLQTWGIHTCGQLAALCETDLIARLGRAGKKIHSLACGTWQHTLYPMEPTFESGLFERIELDDPVDILESLLFLLARMTDALLERVKAKALAIASLRIVLKLDGGKQHERVVRPALPLQDTPTLLKLLQLDLEMHPPSAAIIGLELYGQSAAPYRAQHGLFLPQAPEPGRLEVLLARLRKLLGEERVGSVELTDDHRPNAFRMTPFAPPSPAKLPNSSLSVPSALRVMRPPQVVGVATTREIPTRVFWNGQKYLIRELAGPWRVSGQWWSEAQWCREEWDIWMATETAERVCRIAFDPQSKCWYLQGTYD